MRDIHFAEDAVSIVCNDNSTHWIEEHLFHNILSFVVGQEREEHWSLFLDTHNNRILDSSIYVLEYVLLTWIVVQEWCE
jgi:hypothetical protein